MDFESFFQCEQIYVVSTIIIDNEIDSCKTTKRNSDYIVLKFLQPVIMTHSSLHKTCKYVKGKYAVTNLPTAM